MRKAISLVMNTINVRRTYVHTTHRIVVRTYASNTTSWHFGAETKIFLKSGSNANWSEFTNCKASLSSLIFGLKFNNFSAGGGGGGGHAPRPRRDNNVLS